MFSKLCPSASIGPSSPASASVVLCYKALVSLRRTLVKMAELENGTASALLAQLKGLEAAKVLCWRPLLVQLHGRGRPQHFSLILGQTPISIKYPRPAWPTWRGTSRPGRATKSTQRLKVLNKLTQLYKILSGSEYLAREPQSGV